MTMKYKVQVLVAISLIFAVNPALAYEPNYGDPFSFPSSRLGNYVTVELLPSIDPGVVIMGDEAGSNEFDIPEPGSQGISAQFLTSDKGSIEISLGRKKDVQALPSDDATQRFGIVTRKRSGDSQNWSTFVFSLNHRNWDISRGLDVMRRDILISPAVIVGSFPKSKVSLEFLFGFTAFLSFYEEDDFVPNDREDLSDRMEFRLPFGVKTAYEANDNLHLVGEVTIVPATGPMGDMSPVVPVNTTMGVRYIHDRVVIGAAFFKNMRNPVYNGSPPGESSLLDLEASGVMMNASYAWY